MAELSCSANAAVAFGFLLSKGLRDFQVAAIVGNLQQESGVDPQVPPGDGGTAYGIAQWHDPRWSNLIAYATQTGRSPWSLDVQLEFLWHELQTVSAFGLKSILASTTIDGATIAFQDNFERCGTCDTPSRIAFARAALYTCPAIKSPVTAPKGGWFAATVGVLALVAAAGYGAHAALTRSWRIS